MNEKQIERMKFSRQIEKIKEEINILIREKNTIENKIESNIALIDNYRSQIELSYMEELALNKKEDKVC